MTTFRTHDVAAKIAMVDGVVHANEHVIANGDLRVIEYRTKADKHILSATAQYAAIEFIPENDADDKRGEAQKLRYRPKSRFRW